jgi:hypothetical protein
MPERFKRKALDCNFKERTFRTRPDKPAADFRLRCVCRRWAWRGRAGSLLQFAVREPFPRLTSWRTEGAD